MVGYITVAYGAAQRLSEKWRHFVVHCLYSLYHIVTVPSSPQMSEWHHAPSLRVITGAYSFGSQSGTMLQCPQSGIVLLWPSEHHVVMRPCDHVTM